MYRWYIIAVVTLLWGLSGILGCKAASNTPQPPQHWQEEDPPGGIYQPVTDPGGGDPELPVTGPVTVPEVEDDEPAIPEGQGPEFEDDPGWLQPEPDPAWEEPQDAPKIYLRGFYTRRYQRLNLVAVHEMTSELTVTLRFPDGVSADLPAENVIPGGRGALQFHLAIDPQAADSGLIDISAKDAEGWRVSTDTEYVRALFIDRALYDVETQQLTVVVDALPNEGYQLKLEPPGGIRIEDGTLKREVGCADLGFQVAFDSADPDSWLLPATLTGDRGFQDREQVAVSRLPAGFQTETLYAYPLRTVVEAGETVRIVVASGPTAAPFKYLNGLGIVVNSGASYVDGSLNVGAPGGAQQDPDGIWAAVQPEGFLLPTDFMIRERSVGNGQVRIDFNITPIGGEEVSDGGLLMNCQLAFAAAGDYALRFEAFRDVKRTFYSDSSSEEYYWSDISNELPGVPNTISVH